MRLNNKKPNDRVAVALVLCFCVVAIASIFTMRSNFNQLDLKDDDKINIAQEDNQAKEEEQNVVRQIPTVDSTAPKPDATGDNSVEKKGGSSPYTVPVHGKISKQFSNEIPIYSQTLDEFVVHNGVDIAAPADTQVVAVADGTITKVYNDDRLGITIEVSHGNGIVTKYSNLSTTKMVEEGDVVKRGQPISGVGSSALFESLESPHLHFEALKDGVAIDPSEYM
jgi:murein DD-endopeptidase MepM/ murein hydrolase activator NlpD